MVLNFRSAGVCVYIRAAPQGLSCPNLVKAKHPTWLAMKEASLSDWRLHWEKPVWDR